MFLARSLENGSPRKGDIYPTVKYDPEPTSSIVLMSGQLLCAHPRGNVVDDLVNTQLGRVDCVSTPESRRATRISSCGAEGHARTSPMIAPPSRPVSWPR
jgi:hypothetical protein